LKAVVLNYGVGNLLSIKFGLERAGFKVHIATAPEALLDADAVVLPGVGNFREASKNLDRFMETLTDALESGVPTLGICLGMQLFFEESEEGGRGLGLLRGGVVRLPESVKVPHMGWNTVESVRHSEILEGCGGRGYAYFAHSYHPSPVDREVVAAETVYGVAFPSVVECGNLYGTQFHPEKSGRFGAEILRNFASISKR